MGRLMPRRDLLVASVGVATAACGLLAVSERSSAKADEAPNEQTTVRRYGMLIDARKCISCGACLRACHRQNQLSDEMDFIKFYPDVVETSEGYAAQTVPVQCMHCKDAPCVSVCPTGASYATDDGIVHVDESRCIGCKYCMTACPYSARVVNVETGTVDKCRLCASKVDSAEVPMRACVQACVKKVRIFGDIGDPDSDVSKAIIESGAQKLAGGPSDASIYYVR